MTTPPDDEGTLRERVTELGRERELLNAIANHAPSLICIVDDEGRVRPLATNRAFERTLGYEPEETGGVLFWERYVPPEDAAAVEAEIMRAIASGSPTVRDGQWLTRDGRVIDVEWSCTSLPMIASGPLYLVSAADITDRKAHEEEVRRSRARIVAAADEARKRLERNLHDGAQQRLVTLLLALRVTQRRVADDPTVSTLLTGAIDELSGALEELRELARGIHPAMLTEQGLAAAVSALAERAPLPVAVDVPDERYAEPVEVAAYYIVSEALANVAKYADAASASVSMRVQDRRLIVEVTDDGVGGARASAGTGIRGLVDRVEALEGALAVVSPAGGGTRLRAVLPLG